MSEIIPAPLPEIPLPTVRPNVPVSEYDDRLRAAVAALDEERLDVLVVYGDREQAGDLHHLTAVDPRFEEGILLLDRNGRRRILLGNENQACGPDAALGIEQVLYQELSPQGQFRHRPVQLSVLLGDFGVGAGTRVGVAGGKHLTRGFVRDPQTSFTVPSFLVDALRGLAGHENVRNAEEIFLSPSRGLRVTLSAAQIAEYEYAAAVCSMSVHRAVTSLEPGVVASRIADTLVSFGIERSVHDMVNFGAKTAQGLSSPSEQRAQVGDAFQVAQGLRGALTCRSGAIAGGPEDLGPEIREFYPALATAYFDSLAAWYEALAVGTTAGNVFDAADGMRDPELFAFALNPGHLLDFEEWSASPFVAGDRTRLRPGMVLQGDIIPVGTGPHVGMNIEDGLALADRALREQLQNEHPQLWSRVVARRAYVQQHLGVDLDESVLPFSNTPLWHAPYSLDPTRVLTK